MSEALVQLGEEIKAALPGAVTEAVVAFDETVSAMRGHHPPGKPSAQWTTSAVRNAGR